MTEPKPTLRQLALAAYAEQQRRAADNRAEERRSLEARVRRQFKDDFDAEPDAVAGNLVQVEDDGDPKHATAMLRWLSSQGDGFGAWQLHGTCPLCGRETWSRGVLNLPQLGELLAAFQPANDHHCPEPETRQLRQPTAVEWVLLEALRNWREVE